MNKFNEELIKEFMETKICQFCGSQRCDCSEEWLKGCPEFKKFLKEKDND